MTTRFGLSEATIQKICAVLARYPQVGKSGAVRLAGDGQLPKRLRH